MWYVVTARYISTSPRQKLRNNIDVIDYFAGDNEIYEYAKERCIKGYWYRYRGYFGSEISISYRCRPWKYRPSSNTEVVWSGWSVGDSRSRITAEVMSLFRWNLLLLLVLPMGKKFINFWWWSGPGYEFRTHFHFHYRCGIEDFRRFISISDTVANSAFHPYGVDKTSTNLLGWGEGHLCRVADNTLCDPIDKWRPIVLRWIHKELCV